MNYKKKLSVRISILNSLVRSRLTHGCQTWILTSAQQDRLDSAYCSMIRKMVRGGYRRKPNEWGYRLTNSNLLDLAKTEAVTAFVERQRKRYLGHVIRLPNTSIVKRMMFEAEENVVAGRRTTFIKSVLEVERTSLEHFGRLALTRKV